MEWQAAQKVIENTLQDSEYALDEAERLFEGFINLAFRNTLSTPIQGLGKTEVVEKTEDKLKIEKTTGEEYILHKARSVSFRILNLISYPA